MSSLSLSASVAWLRTTLAVPVSVATLPIGSSEEAGCAEEAVGAAAGRGEDGVAERAGGGELGGKGWFCARSSDPIAPATGATPCSIAGSAAWALAGPVARRPASKASAAIGFRCQVASDPPLRDLVDEKSMPACNPHFAKTSFACCHRVGNKGLRGALRRWLAECAMNVKPRGSWRHV